MWWTMAWTVVRDALLALAAAPIVYYLIATIAAGEFFRAKPASVSHKPLDPASAPQTSLDFFPPVSILKPIRGLDREAYGNFSSFCQQDYPEFEILFCVGDEGDPGVPVIKKVIADFPGRSIRLFVGAPEIGVSDKVNKLCRMAREARHEVVIVSDSDVRVEPGFLRAVVRPFRDPEVGGVTCLPVTAGGVGLAYLSYRSAPAGRLQQDGKRRPHGLAWLGRAQAGLPGRNPIACCRSRR